MKKKAFVFVKCDAAIRGCESGSLVPLIQLASGEWMENDSDTSLQDVGWEIGPDTNYCPRCVRHKKHGPREGACCDNERRDMNGWCRNCGDPCY